MIDTTGGPTVLEAIVGGAGESHVVTRSDFASAMEMRRLVGTDEPF